MVRPTSETMVNHMFAQWVQSWRDLPLQVRIAAVAYWGCISCPHYASWQTVCRRKTCLTPHVCSTPSDVVRNGSLVGCWHHIHAGLATAPHACKWWAHK